VWVRTKSNMVDLGRGVGLDRRVAQAKKANQGGSPSIGLQEARHAASAVGLRFSEIGF
jgi:hypothetical protein